MAPTRVAGVSNSDSFSHNAKSYQIPSRTSRFSGFLASFAMRFTAMFSTNRRRQFVRNVVLLEHLDNDFVPDLGTISAASRKAALLCQELPLLHVKFVMYFGINFYPVFNYGPEVAANQKMSYQEFEEMSQWMLELKRGKDTAKKCTFSIQVPDLFDQRSISRCLKARKIWPVNFFWFLANQATIDEINGVPWAPEDTPDTKYLI
ncbi:uncharacterized protein BDZ99DRAFT_553116 [Mytilinidion resinicola]|uniref:Uncharacterized protein n=1 Tax=Mytilinidion resinicola TaxID=574789 RepID=A0A6A6XYM9_9PEZI|nr:uncharacterized protein BDZ99DRAFT_553116 [Mytilinidion resinicola]KAF2801602.1 hypothetical protein BDZ99DRAFT_553116 [Mytilinidion resinicola]